MNVDSPVKSAGKLHQSGFELQSDWLKERNLRSDWLSQLINSNDLTSNNFQEASNERSKSGEVLHVGTTYLLKRP